MTEDQTVLMTRKYNRLSESLHQVRSGSGHPDLIAVHAVEGIFFLEELMSLLTDPEGLGVRCPLGIHAFVHEDPAVLFFPPHQRQLFAARYGVQDVFRGAQSGV